MHLTTDIIFILFKNILQPLAQSAKRDHAIFSAIRQFDLPAYLFSQKLIFPANLFMFNPSTFIVVGLTCIDPNNFILYINTKIKK